MNAKVITSDLLGLIDDLNPPPQAPGDSWQDHEQRLENLRSRCSAVAKELNKKLKGVSLDDINNASSWKKLKIVIKSMWSKEDIADFQTQLGTFTQEMQLHILVDLR